LVKTRDKTKAALKKFSRVIRIALKQEGKMDPKALKLYGRFAALKIQLQVSVLYRNKPAWQSS